MADTEPVEDEDAAVDALKQFGLSTYEARVFVALQKLEAGSASEVSEVTDVPRSQVYGAADELEARGLVDVQQGTPTRYRPVGIEEARERLYEGLRATGDAAFAYIDDVQGQNAGEEEQGESIWTVEGKENVAARCVSLIGETDSEVVYATGDPEALNDVRDALHDALDRGASVTVVSAERPVLDATREITEGIETLFIPADSDPDMSTGRVLLADRDTVLLSVGPAGLVPQVSAETAFWSSTTGFARLLAAIIREWFEGVAVG
ncbi:MAG: TrmB family transcriptional regulator [Halobacteriales archaeon]